MNKRWKCLVCGYIHEGDEPPDVCPLCGAHSSQFELLPAEPAKSAEPAEPAAKPTPSQPGGAVSDHLHPILAHFPNGLMPAVCLLLVAGWVFKRPALEEAVIWLVGLVTLIAPLNIATGIKDWKRYFKGAKAPIFRKKIILGVLLLLLGVAALLLRLAGGESLFSLYLACIAGMLGCAGWLGFLGGQLMFGAARKDLSGS